VPSFQKCRRPVEDVGILSEEAEDQPSHEVVHVVTAIDGSPYRVVYQKFNIEPVQSVSINSGDRGLVDPANSPLLPRPINDHP
jgi:hypothetical protein